MFSKEKMEQPFIFAVDLRYFYSKGNRKLWKHQTQYKQLQRVLDLQDTFPLIDYIFVR